MKKRYFAFIGITSAYVVILIMSYQYLQTLDGFKPQDFYNILPEQIVGYFVLSGFYFGVFAIIDEIKKRKQTTKTPIA